MIQASGKKALGPAAREVLRAAFAVGCVTLADLQRRRIVQSCECPWCGRADTVAHRLFTDCENPLALGLRSVRAELDLGALFLEAGGRGERKEKLPLFFPSVDTVSHGLLDVADIEVNGTKVTIDELEVLKPFRKEGGPVFLDGSCLDSSAGYARAAAPLVQLGEDGRPKTTVTLCVPSDWEQTAAAAEHLAAAVFDKAAEPGLVAVTDCYSVRRAACEGLRWAEAERRPWAALWRRMSWGWSCFVKVKAHLTRDEAAAMGRALPLDRQWCC